MLYRIDDRGLLTSVLTGEGVFLDPGAVLDGLSSHQAHARPHNLPHSIADIVAHMCFWQEWFNECVAAEFKGVPQHAADGWPAVSPDGWEALRTRYLRAMDIAKRLAEESDSLDGPLLPATVQNPYLSRESHGSGLLRGAVHNAHHLGQIITLRQLMGLWPPPGGTMTW